MDVPLHHLINFLNNYFLQKVDRVLGTTYSKPTFIALFLTKECNSKCGMCFLEHDSLEKEISTEQAKELIVSLKKWLGPFTLTFSGGESTLRRDIWELIAFANGLRIRTALSTNGTTITKKNIPQIMNSNPNDVKISLDSLNPKTYQKIRGINSLKRVLQTIDLLKNNTKNTNVSINIVITKHNIKEIPLLIEFAKQKKLNANINALVIINGDAKKELSYLWPSYKKVETIIDRVIEYKKKGYPVSNSFEHLRLIKKYYKNPDSIKEECSSPLRSFMINASGYVTICKTKKVGNVLQKTPKDIWDSKKNKQMRKKLYKCKKNCSIATCNINGSLITKFKQYYF